jgi:hypothetical protein
MPSKMIVEILTECMAFMVFSTQCTREWLDTKIKGDGGARQTQQFIRVLNLGHGVLIWNESGMCATPDKGAAAIIGVGGGRISADHTSS